MHTIHPQCLYSFSYPGSCVLKCPPHSFPARESNIIATSFLSDAFQRLPSICGCRLSFATKCFAPKRQLQYASSSMQGTLKQVQMPLEPIISSSVGGTSVKDTSYTLAGAKRKATPLMNSSDQMVPGKHNGGGGGGGDIASTHCTGNAEKAAQPNKSVYVPKFGPLVSRPHTTPLPASASATVQPPAKKPAHRPSAPNSTLATQMPAQTPARGPPQARTVPHQTASVPMREQLQPTPTASHRPNSTTQTCPSGTVTASNSEATHNTQSKGPGPFQQVPTSLLSGVEDDDAFYPAMHSKRVQ